MNIKSAIRFVAALSALVVTTLNGAEPDKAAVAAASTPAATAAPALEVANPLKASAATPEAIAYKPSMPDMMNIAILPRHEKLAIAGRKRNWKYLAYETRELRGAFTKIARTAPAHDGWDTLAMFNSMIMTPIKNLEDAVKAEDGKAFDTNFAALTDACNACHVVVGRDYIVIKVPRDSAYPNQEFRATRTSKSRK